MEFRNLLADDDAVSPVIGVILMVAITVILAAVIGTFVLGLGDQVQQTSPTAQFSFDYTEDGANGDTLEITHDGGDGITATQLTFAGDVQNLGTNHDWNTAADTTTSTVTAGDSATLAESDGDNYLQSNPSSVSVIWNAEDGDRSSTLAEWTN